MIQHILISTTSLIKHTIDPPGGAHCLSKQKSGDNSTGNMPMSTHSKITQTDTKACTLQGDEYSHLEIDIFHMTFHHI